MPRFKVKLSERKADSWPDDESLLGVQSGGNIMAERAHERQRSDPTSDREGGEGMQRFNVKVSERKSDSPDDESLLGLQSHTVAERPLEPEPRKDESGQRPTKDSPPPDRS